MNASDGPNPIPKSEGENEVETLYQTFGVSVALNVAYCEIDVNNLQEELISVSGFRSPEGTVPSPASRLFQIFDTPPGFYRGNDAEVKLLEATAKVIEPNAQNGQRYPDPTGSIRLYSHFTICPSCDNVIAAFRAMFPNIALSVSDGT